LLLAAITGKLQFPAKIRIGSTTLCATFVPKQPFMEQYAALLQDLYDKIPRRHNAENVGIINSILDDYVTILGKIESINPWYEKNTAGFYPTLESIQNNIKMSNSSKHAKKAKDALFDEASGSLKDDIQALIAVYGNGDQPAG